MPNIGFTREDFEVFGIPTFPERMQGIKSTCGRSSSPSGKTCNQP